MAQNYEPGAYKAKVTGQRYGQNSNGKPYFAIEFEPTEATGANDMPETVYRRELTLYMSEAAAKYSIDNLRRLGWSGTDFTELEPSSANPHLFGGDEIEVVCEHDGEYERWNLPAPGNGAAKESDSAVAGKLNKLFGKALKTNGSKPKTKAKKPEPVAAAVPAPPDDDSELPF